MSEREFVVINEEAARTAQNMMSFNEYQLGSRTKEYQEDVNEVYDLAEEVVARRGEEYRERAWRLATRYAKNLGKYFNEEARIGCMCPSVMISGAGNFPVKKKEKQVKAWDKNHEFYNYCQSIRGKLNNLLYSKEVIKSDDENAIEALEEKIDSLREVQENMKEINKYYRKHHTLEGCDLLTEKQLQKLQGSMDQFGYDRSPYPSWALQNNLANIKRCQQRVDELKKTKEKGTSEADYGDFKVIENTELMRIQIVFDGKRSKQLGKEIRDSRKRYEDLRVHGGSDPFWSDGANMNLCRNHVMYFRKQVETELDPENYPEEYFLEIPAEVSVHYMADPDGIRSRSTAALEVLKENQDFQYLRSKLSGDLDKETSQCMNPVRYVLGMEDAIRRDDLVVMRRCQDPEYYVKYLRESRKKLDKILGSPILEPKLREGQLTIWDFIGGQ